MHRLPSLQQVLQRAIIPKVAAVLLLVSIALSIALFYVANEQLKQTHETYIIELENEIERGINNSLRELQNIAANDLLINGLIDTDYQNNYLPLFIQSFHITKAPDISLALFDFSGERMLAKNWVGIVPDSLQDDWKSTVLGQAGTYYQINENGVLLAAPITLNNVAEGALVLYVNSIHWMIESRQNPAYQVMLSPDNTVLYSSNPNRTPAGSIFKKEQLSDNFVQQDQWRNYTVLSFEPLLAAYQNVLWFIPVLLLAIFTTVLGSVLSVRSASILASSTLKRLHQSLLEQLRNETTKAHAKLEEKIPEEAMELAQIRTAFERLSANLDAVSLSNAKFSNVINSMDELLLVIDNNGDVLLSNQAYQHFCTQYEISAKDLSPILNAYRFSSEERNLREYTSKRSAPIFINWNNSPLLNSSGEFIGTVLVGENVTQQRELERNLRIQLHAIEEATVGIVIADISQPSQPIIYANKMFSQITGYRNSEVIDQNCKMLQGKDTAKEDIEKIRTAIKQRKGIDITLLNYRKDGSPFYNQLILSPIPQENNNVTHYIGIQQDVTMQEYTAKYLAQARERAEESAQLKSRFLASMSHEVRTPINGIYGMLGLLQKTELDEKQANYVNMAKDSTANLLYIINDILDFSKIEAGKLQIEQAPFNLYTLFEKVVQHHRFESDSKQISLQMELDFDSTQLVLGDQVRLRQIVGNLLSNAIKFTNQGRVCVTAQLDKRDQQIWHLCCEVSDTGIGIDNNKLSHMFSVFSQEDDSTTREYGGTGLGLAICKQLCHLMNGDITVTSEKGVGSCFRFSVELGSLTSKPDDNHNAPQNNDNLKTAWPDGYKPAILLVEDNEINQIVAKENLHNCRVLTATNGEEALSALKQITLKFDLILMDCQMPVMDGFEATKRIRSGECGDDYKNVPIIALTANAMLGDKEACLAAGMDSYISKPFNEKELLDQVYKWAGSKRDN